MACSAAKEVRAGISVRVSFILDAAQVAWLAWYGCGSEIGTFGRISKTTRIKAWSPLETCSVLVQRLTRYYPAGIEAKDAKFAFFALLLWDP